jgi:hypothetical protein
MLEGLWTVDFISNLGEQGAGVIVFKGNQILGGDSAYLYSGSYTSGGNDVKGKIVVKHYAGIPYSIFGNLKEFEVIVSGKIQQPLMEVSGHLVGNPNMKITARCTKRT